MLGPLERNTELVALVGMNGSIELLDLRFGCEVEHSTVTCAAREWFVSDSRIGRICPRFNWRYPTLRRRSQAE